MTAGPTVNPRRAATRVLRERSDAAARKMFHVSLAYLFSLFLAMNVELIAGI